MRPIYKLCTIVLADGTNQSHDMNEIYNVNLYQSMNFLNVQISSAQFSSAIFKSGLSITNTRTTEGVDRDVRSERQDMISGRLRYVFSRRRMIGSDGAP